jgi:hypothetical protein
MKSPSLAGARCSGLAGLPRLVIFHSRQTHPQRLLRGVLFPCLLSRLRAFDSPQERFSALSALLWRLTEQPSRDTKSASYRIAHNAFSFDHVKRTTRIALAMRAAKALQALNLALQPLIFSQARFQSRYGACNSRFSARGADLISPFAKVIEHTH